jgi:PAS domain S-box-containing protein
MENYQYHPGAIIHYIYTVNLKDGNPIETIHHGPTCFLITGYKDEEFKNNSYLWIDMVHEEDKDLVKGYVQKILEGIEVEPIEHRILRKDGTVRWVRNTPVLHYDNQRKLISYDGVVQDITYIKESGTSIQKLHDNLKVRVEELAAEVVKTNGFLSREIKERIRLEKKLMEIHRMETIGKCAVSIVHNLNNFLETIIIYIGLIEQEIPKEPRVENKLEEIAKMCNYAKELLMQISNLHDRHDMDDKTLNADFLNKESLNLLKTKINNPFTEDSTGQFIKECCIIEKGYKATAKDLYEAYMKWCIKNEKEMISQRAMGLQLTDRGFIKRRISSGETRGRFFYENIGIAAKHEE